MKKTGLSLIFATIVFSISAVFGQQAQTASAWEASIGELIKRNNAFDVEGAEAILNQTLDLAESGYTRRSGAYAATLFNKAIIQARRGDIEAAKSTAEEANQIILHEKSDPLNASDVEFFKRSIGTDLILFNSWLYRSAAIPNIVLSNQFDEQTLKAVAIPLQLTKARLESNWENVYVELNKIKDSADSKHDAETSMLSRLAISELALISGQTDIGRRMINEISEIINAEKLREKYYNAVELEAATYKAYFLAASGERKQALKFIEKTERLLDQNNKINPCYLVRAQLNEAKAIALQNEGNYDSALQAAVSAIDYYKKIVTNGDARFSRALLLQADILYAKKDFQGSEKILKRSMKNLEIGSSQNRDYVHFYIGQTAMKLFFTLTAIDHSDEADAYAVKAYGELKPYEFLHANEDFKKIGARVENLSVLKEVSEARRKSQDNQRNEILKTIEISLNASSEQMISRGQALVKQSTEFDRPELIQTLGYILIGEAKFKTFDFFHASHVLSVAYKEFLKISDDDRSKIRLTAMRAFNHLIEARLSEEIDTEELEIVFQSAHDLSQLGPINEDIIFETAQLFALKARWLLIVKHANNETLKPILDKSLNNFAEYRKIKKIPSELFDIKAWPAENKIALVQSKLANADLSQLSEDELKSKIYQIFSEFRPVLFLELTPRNAWLIRIAYKIKSEGAEKFKSNDDEKSSEYKYNLSEIIQMYEQFDFSPSYQLGVLLSDQCKRLINTNHQDDYSDILIKGLSFALKQFENYSSANRENVLDAHYQFVLSISKLKSPTTADLEMGIDAADNILNLWEPAMLSGFNWHPVVRGQVAMLAAEFYKRQNNTGKALEYWQMANEYLAPIANGNDKYALKAKNFISEIENHIKEIKKR